MGQKQSYEVHTERRVLSYSKRKKRVRHPVFRAMREYIHALPLTSELDALCGGIYDSDPALPMACSAGRFVRSISKTKKHFFTQFLIRILTAYRCSRYVGWTVSAVCPIPF